MEKKISAKIFILFASILLVAHAVIPHLHYKNEVFIVTSACSSNEIHKHQAPEHNDDCASNQHSCILKQVVLIRHNDSKTELIDTATDTKSDFKNIPFSILTASHIFNFKPEQKISPPLVLNTPFYFRLIDCNINSRGSPTV